MKLAFLFIVMTIWGCSHNRGPASLTDKTVAQDSMAGGNVRATAVKVVEGTDVCFDIQVTMKGVQQREASASNWTIAWTDQASKYHLINTSSREPASEPKGGMKTAAYGAWEEWTNTFRTCAPQAKFQDVRAIVLTPKELTFKETDSLNLEWK